MKNTLIRLIPILLLIAMLLPLAVACKKDPPPNNDEDDDDDNTENGEENEVNSYYFDLKIKNQTDYKIVDLENEQFVNSNDAIKNAKTSCDGVPVIKWNTATTLTANLTESYSLLYASSIKFSVYSEEASGASVKVGFPYVNKPEKTGDASSENILIDFVGWKDFEFIPNKMTGTGMGDKMACKFQLTANKNADGSTPNQTLYFSGVTVTKTEYEVITPEGVDINDPTLYTAITDRARAFSLGTADILDTNEYKNSLNNAINTCKTRFEQYKAYNKAPSNAAELDKLFGFDTTDHIAWNKGEAAISNYYGAVLAMAKGYGMPSSPKLNNPYYHSEELLTAIIYCLDYGYEFYYGQNAVDGGAYANWWWWKIGIAQQLIPILLIIEDKLTPELCDHYLTCFDHHVPYPEANAGNKIWLSRLAILSAALRRNALDICIDTMKMNDLFDYIDSYISEGGFFRDGSFIQHQNFAYTSGYGATYMNDLPQLLYVLSGSRFYPQQDNINNLYTWIIESFRPIMFENIKMSSLSGREVGRGNQEDVRSYVGYLIFIHSFAPDTYKGELEKIIAYFMQKNNSSFAYQTPFIAINHANELYEKLKDIPLDDYEIARVYGMMSRVIQHRPSYAVCLALSSTNIAKYESINAENLTGWYQGDGAVFIYTNNLISGKGYSFDQRFYWYADPLLVPGTTVNSAQRNLNGTHNQNLFNASDYAGGATQGKYASIGYIHGYNTVSSSFKNENDKKIRANKSYFMFDNEIVCVGSDIYDLSGTDVKTVIDNRIWESGDTFSIAGNAVSTPATVATDINERVLHFTNMGGYVILKNDGCTLRYRKATGMWHGTQGDKPATANGSADFLELYLVHGKGNGTLDNSNYYYAYLPEASVEQTNAYAANPDVTLLARNSDVHAVLEKKLGIVAANFFVDAAEQTVEVDDSSTAVKSIAATSLCSVIVSKGEDGQYRISVADPTRSYSTLDLTVQIEGISEIVGKDDKVTASISGDTVTVKVNTQGSLGATYELTVK